MISGEDTVFQGRDGHECEEFIRAIHKTAYAAGKLRDNEWMADLALTCLSGRALRYYESLEPEVKRDWSLLRPALLAKYPPPDGDEYEMQGQGSSMRQVLAPAGPQGPRLNARVGRIKIIGANSADWGYLGDGQTVWTNGIGGAASTTEAIRVSYVPANTLHEIEILRDDGRPEALGVHWHEASPTTAFGSGNYAAITAFNYEVLYRSSQLKLNWAGPGYTRIWSIMADNTLCPHLEEYGSGNPLHFFLYTPEHKRYAVAVAADASTFVSKYGGWTLVKLLFEPIVQSPEERSADEA